ncbi:MAG: hypothetical protein IPN86_07725 [Saprospiraceae bacterium]|nr:hypothetical protein [Saprospiraceae bacterium]
MNMRDTVKKPSPCHQNWEDMIPAEKGRICLGCGKKVTDFRNYNWVEIEKAHKSSPIPVCGIYTDEQISSWDTNSSGQKSCSSRYFAISAALLALTQFPPNIVSAQKIDNQEQTPINKPAISLENANQKIICGTVVVINADTTMLPLKGVLIQVLQENMLLESTSDSFGRFNIDITNSFSKLPDNLDLIISHQDYLVQPITLNKNNLKPLDIILSDVTIKAKKIQFTDTNTSFYAVVSPKSTSSSETLKKEQKKWWQFWKRNK